MVGCAVDIGDASMMRRAGPVGAKKLRSGDERGYKAMGSPSSVEESGQRHRCYCCCLLLFGWKVGCGDMNECKLKTHQVEESTRQLAVESASRCAGAEDTSRCGVVLAAVHAKCACPCRWEEQASWSKDWEPWPSGWVQERGLEQHWGTKRSPKPRRRELPRPCCHSWTRRGAHSRVRGVLTTAAGSSLRARWAIRRPTWRLDEEHRLRGCWEACSR